MNTVLLAFGLFKFFLLLTLKAIIYDVIPLICFSFPRRIKCLSSSTMNPCILDVEARTNLELGAEAENSRQAWKKIPSMGGGTWLKSQIPLFKKMIRMKVKRTNNYDVFTIYHEDALRRAFASARGESNASPQALLNKRKNSDSMA